MNSKASRPCAYLGCPELADNGRWCANHAHMQRTPDTRPSARRRGYDRHWEATRAEFIATHPNCAECGKLAQHVDHIKPMRLGGGHDWSNLRALCHSCHSRKTAAQDGGFGNAVR